MGSEVDSRVGVLAKAGELRAPMDDWMVDGFAGVVSALVTIVYAIGCGVLVFSGNLSGFLHLGITSAMVCAAVVGLIMALTSAFPFTIAGPDTRAAALMALTSSSIGAALSGAEAAYTIWMSLAAGAILTGAFLYLLGRLGLGRSIRFIPYPVVGGFLAGTGWLLTTGSIKVMAGIEIGWHTWRRLGDAERLILWVPGVVFGVLLMIILKRWRHHMAFPGFIALGLLLAYASMAVAGMSLEAARTDGLFFQTFSQESFLQPYRGLASESVDWVRVAGQGFNMAAMATVVAITILMSASGLELQTGVDADLDHELKFHGLANVLAGLGGGMAGCLVVNRSLLNYQAGARGRRAGVLCGLVCAAIVLFNVPLLAIMPKAVLGGLLFCLGLTQLWEWVVQGWWKLSRLDYGIVLLILLVIGLTGFLQGVALGVVVAAIIFAVNYSRINVVKCALTGVHQRSNVDRAPREAQLLSDHGGAVHILWLRGFIFFGTANSIVEEVRRRLAGARGVSARFVLLDFARVTGLDSSGVLSFIKLKRLAKSLNVSLVLTGLQADVRRQLETGGCLVPNDRSFLAFEDLDYGLEWCEEQVLAAQLSDGLQTPPIEEVLAELLGSGRTAAAFLGYLAELNVKQGFVLFKQGELSDSLYFLESGRVTVLMETLDRQTKRLRSMGPGTVVGEMGLYLGSRRSATVVTDCTSRLYQLTRESLNRLQKEDPATAAAFHEFVVRLLAERLASGDRRLQAFME